MAPAAKVCDSGLFEAKTEQKPCVSSILGQKIAKSWQGSFHINLHLALLAWLGVNGNEPCEP